jgi:hypothetical protein
MPRRLLNIASIVCLVLCVALMGMWVRSYCTLDEMNRHLATQQGWTIASIPGRVILMHEYAQGSRDWLRTLSRVTNESDRPEPGGPFYQRLGSYLRINPSTVLMLPYWFLVLVSGSLAMIFRLRWPLQFNLRSLFIATTLLAVVLGMIAWLDRAWIGK